MTRLNSNPTHSSAVAARVRQNVIGAGVAAGMMLYFGYRVVGISEGEGAFGLGSKLFVYTLRIGGLAMAAAALGSLAGITGALLLDGVCSVTIGVLFTLSAVLMLVGGGSGFLYILFGVLFVVAGVRNAREWTALARERGADAGRSPGPSGSFASEPVESRAPESLADGLRDAARHSPVETRIGRAPDVAPPVHVAPRPPSTSPANEAPPPVPGPSDSPQPAATNPPIEPPPEGFLASFAPDTEDEPDDA